MPMDLSKIIKKSYASVRRSFELSLFLAKAGFKLRNEGSYLGILWYLLNPLLLFLIILFIRGVAFAPSKIEYYPVYLLFGIVMNNLFSNIISGSIGIIGSNAGFVKSMKIKFEPFVFANTIQYIFSHMFEVVLIAGFMFFYHISLFGLFYYFIVLIFFLIFLTGASFLFSTIGIHISDFKNVWGFATQLIFFITPTFYAIKPTDTNYFINLFNPLFYFLTIARELVIYERMPELWMIFTAIGISTGFFIIGLLVFEKYKNKFAELV